MQISKWTPPVRQNSQSNSHQTLSSMQYGPAPQMGYNSPQQKSFDEHSSRLSNPHYLQSTQTPQRWGSESQSQLPYISLASARHPSRNIVHHSSFQAGREGTLTVNLTCDPLVSNATIQRNYNDLQSMQYGSCTSSAPLFSGLSVPRNVNSYCMSGSIPPCRQGTQHHGVQTTHQPSVQPQQTALTSQFSQTALTINMNQGQMSVVEQYNGTANSVAHFPVVSRESAPVDSLLPSQFRTFSSQLSQSRVQNALCHPSPCTKYEDYIKLKQSSSLNPPLLYRARLNSAIYNQSNQRRNQVSTNLTQDKIQSQTTPISSHHSKTNVPTFSVIKGSMQPQVLQSNNTMSGLTMNSQDITSFNTSTSQASSSTSGSRSTNCSHSLLHQLVRVDISQSTAPTSSSNSFGSQFAKSKYVSQQTTHDYIDLSITTGKNYSQGKARQETDYQKPVKETGISRRNYITIGSHLAQPQVSSHNEMTNWKKRNVEVQSCANPNNSTKLSLSQHRKVQQLTKAVAVVSPISQQASSHGQQNDVTTSSQDGLFLKTDTVKNLFVEFEKMEKETDATNMTLKHIEAPPQVPSSPSSLPNDPTSASQSCDFSLRENGPVSTTQSFNCQDAVRIVGLTSKSSVEQNDNQKLESPSENTTFSLSTVPVVDYTLQELNDLVKSLEVKPAERDKSAIRDVVKCILDLYFEGEKKNLIRLLAVKGLLKTSAEQCVKESCAVVFQHVVPKHLKMLENCSQILINKTTSASEDYRSSWLNVGGQPADVEKVLAEPISDYNLTWCRKVLQSISANVVNVADNLVQTHTDNTEASVHAHKDMSKTTTDSIPEDICHSDPQHSAAIFNCKTDQEVLEKGCVSRTPNKFPMIRRKSKKRFNEQLHDEVDMVTKNKRAYTEPSLTSSYDADSTNDLPEIVLLSSEDARKIFTECSEGNQNREPHRICQEEKKDLVTHCVKSHSGSVKVKPLNDFKFTCSHVTDLDCGSDFFCPSCLNKTPLLAFDQDETLFTTKDGELNTDRQKQSHSFQSDKPIEYPSVPVCLESCSIIKSNGSDPNSGDQAQSSSPSPTGIAGTKNSSITEPAAETEPRDLKTESADSPSVAKILTEMFFSSRNSSCKNVKSHKSDADPDADDILLRTDRSMSRDDNQYRKESKESAKVPIKQKYFEQLTHKSKLGTPSKMPISGTPKCKNTVPHKKKRPIIKGKGHDGQSKATKKVRLKLYGSNRKKTSCHEEKKMPSTPVYLTVSPSLDSGKNYTDEPSAKEKVYSQWSTTFINPQKKLFKKRQKPMENRLKLKIQSLKIAIEDRIMAINGNDQLNEPKAKTS